jgi:hypothetical protein
LRTTCRRREEGQPIKDAMREQRLTLPRLAELTKELDPDGNGVSFQLIGRLTTAQGLSARETTSPRSAALIARALERPEEALFERGSIGASADSTERETVVNAA